MEKLSSLQQDEVKLSLKAKNELGGENLNNLNLLSQAIKEKSQESEIELHLLLVGGMVRPEKQGRYHKDVDLLVYSPILAPEFYKGGNHEKFDKLADFFKKVNEGLDWKVEVEDPWFMDYETGGDGKIIMTNNVGVPIEILAVREDCLNGSFKDFLASERNPYEVIF